MSVYCIVLYFIVLYCVVQYSIVFYNIVVSVLLRKSHQSRICEFTTVAAVSVYHPCLCLCLCLAVSASASACLVFYYRKGLFLTILHYTTLTRSLLTFIQTYVHFNFYWKLLQRRLQKKYRHALRVTLVRFTIIQIFNGICMS